MKDSFIMYTQYKEQLDLLSNEQKGILLDAMLLYQMGENLPEMDAITTMCFSFIRARIDRDNEAYEEKCKQNAENGKKGGRPKKMDASEKNQTVSQKTERFSEKPKKADIDIDTDNDIELDTDTKEKDLPKGKSKKKASEKVAFGEYQNVKLTMDEYTKLAEEYGETVRKACITFLDEYIAEKSYKSRSHYLAIRRWVVDAVKKKQVTAQRPRDSLEESYQMMAEWANERSAYDATGI